MWYTHWQCQFQSMNGTQYAVNICKQTARVGDIVQLTGASQPFSTQEDDSDDIFTPIRTQTGYLRVIDTDGTLMAALIPANNTECLVQLWSGSNSGGTFTTHNLRWQGFLQAQAYTQPWDNNANVLELPVKSLLGALEDVSIDETFASTEKNVVALILAAFDNFGLVADNDLTYLVITADVSDAPNTLLKPFIQMSVFFDKETVDNQGDSYEQLVGQSYYEALSAVMSLYGLQLREEGTKIYMNQFDGLDVKVWSIGWGFLTNIAGGSSIVVTPTVLAAEDMLTALTFKGADNIAGYSQGGRSAKVTLSIKRDWRTLITLPLTYEDSSEVKIVVFNDDAKLYGQIHDPRTNLIEIFSFKDMEYTIRSGGYWDFSFDGEGSFLGCKNDSVFFKKFPTENTNEGQSNYLTTGAFPVRWFFQPNSETVTLKSGLYMLQTSVQPGDGGITDLDCYSISANNVILNEGYIVIDFNCYVCWGSRTRGLHFNNPNTTDTITLGLRVSLMVGNKYWNGTAWTTTESTFFIDVDSSGHIISNKEDSMYVEGSNGWFIPCDGFMTGAMQFKIYNTAYVSGNTQGGITGKLYAWSKILSDLVIENRFSEILTASTRSENTYRRNILLNGFMESKEVNLTLGTFNNNVKSFSFIKQDLTTYIERFPYIDASATINQRPELHLLDRMAYHYGQVRRMFSGIVQRGVELMQTVYGYSGRLYFGVKASTNWRDDTEEVRFIEV